MKAVMFSINKPHTDNIVTGIKTIELRTKPPKIEDTYKAYIYETSKSGGCGKVIGEFTAYNEETYRICMGVPKHLIIEGCLSEYEICKYSDNGKKDITAISITDLIRYDKPKELSEFKKINRDCWYADLGLAKRDCPKCRNVECFLTRPPQSWCYVERKERDKDA